MVARCHNEPSKVVACEGEVQIDGPGSVAVSMTPNAARQTADRLASAAGDADSHVADEGQPDRSDIDDTLPSTPSP